MNAWFTWGALSGLLIAISGWQYMWGVYRRTIPRPSISTWGMWTVLGLLILLAYKDAGARMDTTLPMAVMTVFNPAVILVLSLRYGELTWARLDTWCTLIFVVIAVGWYTSNNPLVGLLGAMAVDLVSSIPQIKKNWMEPHDEPWYSWTLFGVGSAVNLLAVEEWEVGQWILPAYYTLGSLSISLPVIMYRLGFYKNQSAVQKI